MPIRHAQAQWQGTLKEGSGYVRLESGVYAGPYSWAGRFADGRGTNPEELVGAAHAACYAMFLSAILTRNEAPPVNIETRASVHLEDGPTITHGGMPYGAGTVAARQAGATKLVDPRPYAVGSIAATFERYPDIGNVLPAMGYGDEQVKDLEATIEAAPADVVLVATPVDLRRIIRIKKPALRVRYELEEVGHPDLVDALREL